MTRASEMGAHLEKLYQAGTVEIPAIANAFGTAGKGFSTLFFSYALARDANLGTSSTGPSSELAAFGATMRAATVGAYNDLTDVAGNLTATAQDLARTEDDVRAAFLALGGKLS